MWKVFFFFFFWSIVVLLSWLLWSAASKLQFCCCATEFAKSLRGVKWLFQCFSVVRNKREKSLIHRVRVCGPSTLPVRKVKSSPIACSAVRGTSPSNKSTANALHAKNIGLTETAIFFFLLFGANSPVSPPPLQIWCAKSMCVCVQLSRRLIKWPLWPEYYWSASCLSVLSCCLCDYTTAILERFN